MNFRALISYFLKKFLASLRSAWILFLFYILLVSLCSLSSSRSRGPWGPCPPLSQIKTISLCTSWHFLVNIILTQAITFLVCKDWSKVFLHTLAAQKYKLCFCKIVLKFQQKCAHDSRKIHILKLKMQELLEPPSGPLTLGLHTNVSVN